LISLVENKDNEIGSWKMPVSFIGNFYKVSYKKKSEWKIKIWAGLL